MKNLILITTLVLSSYFSFAKTLITAVKNDGLWTSANSWSLNRVPTNNDSIVIPSGIIIQVNNSISFLNNVSIIVDGNLDFLNVSILALDQNSTLYIASGGIINGIPNAGQFIFIGFTPIFVGNTLTGSALFNSSGISTPLPVKFINFTAAINNGNVLLQWSTSQEINASMFELERSFDGNSWNTIAYISAVGNSNEISRYSYTDKNIKGTIIYYRVKELDFKGKETYTTVMTVHNLETIVPNDIKIGTTAHQVFILFPKAVKGTVHVTFVSLGGQVISSQILNEPSGQIVLNAASIKNGNYIISVSNGQDIKTAKQIIL